MPGNNWIDFAALAHLPLTHGDLWAGKRSFTVPLFYKLVGAWPPAIVWLQGACATAAWSWLAAQIARLYSHRWAQLFAFAAILTLALSHAVIGWEAWLGSESLSISLFALTVAESLRFARRCGEDAQVIASGLRVVAAASLFTFARDTNAFFVAPLGIALVVYYHSLPRATRTLTRAHIFTGAALVVIAIAAQLNVQASGRYRAPITDRVLLGVLPNPELRTYYAEHYGLPLTPDVLACAAKSHADQIVPEELSDWVAEHGYAAVRAEIFRQPWQSVKNAARISFLTDDDNGTLHPPRSWLTRLLDIVFTRGPIMRHPLIVAAVLLVLGIAWRRRLVGALIIFLLGAAAINAFVSYHGDVLQVHRHVVLVGISLRLLMIVALAEICNQRLARSSSV